MRKTQCGRVRTREWRRENAITVQVAALTEQLIVWKTQAGQKELHQIKVSEEAAAAREKATAEAATQEDRMASREEAAERDRTSANVHNWRERRD